MRSLLFCVLCLSHPAHAAPDAPAAAGEKVPLRARLDKDTIRAAIATVPPEKAPAARPGEPSVLSSGAYEKFSREFSDARLPGCLRPDGLRNQPTFFLGGVLALPFIAVAKVRGVCR